MQSLVSTLGASDVTHIFVHDAIALLKNIPRDVRFTGLVGFVARTIQK